jgi:hypothetical protein
MGTVRNSGGGGSFDSAHKGEDVMQQPQPPQTEQGGSSPLKQAGRPQNIQDKEGGIVEPGQTDFDQGAGPKSNTPLPG